MIGRRAVLGGLASAALVGGRSGRAAAEPAPETTAIRLVQTISICQAPEYVAEALLRAEGSMTITYTNFDGLESQALGRARST
jgi:NitT/TauT family transport system substrate-binding protein